MTHWIDYEFINKSHICRLLWGNEIPRETITSRLTYRKNHPTSWKACELEKLEEIRQGFALQLEQNKPINFI